MSTVKRVRVTFDVDVKIPDAEMCPEGGAYSQKGILTHIMLYRVADAFEGIANEHRTDPGVLRAHMVDYK